MTHKNDQRYNDADYAFNYKPENRATADKNFIKEKLKEAKEPPYFNNK